MDYSSLIPSFDSVLPELLNKNNRLLLVGGSGVQPISDLATALKNEGYDVAIYQFGATKIEAPSDITLSKDIKNIATPGAVAVILTSSQDSLNAIKDVMMGGIDRIWLEIGSETAESIEFLKNAHATTVFQMPIAREALNETARESAKHQRKDS